MRFSMGNCGEYGHAPNTNCTPHDAETEDADSDPDDASECSVVLFFLHCVHGVPVVVVAVAVWLSAASHPLLRIPY